MFSFIVQKVRSSVLLSMAYIVSLLPGGRTAIQAVDTHAGTAADFKSKAVFDAIEKQLKTVRTLT